VLVASVVTLLLDEVCKSVAVAWLAPWPTVTTLGPLHLALAYDQGDHLYQSGMPTLVVVAILILCAALCAATSMVHSTALRVGSGIAIGGALANLSDHVTRGLVPDFLIVGTNQIANVADVAIVTGAVVGAVGLLVGLARTRRQTAV
jgi:lipoprotein signal peptidase